ncbi:MAG: hypothetical protein WD226_01890 [Planctomycetota bacterium]
MTTFDQRWNDVLDTLVESVAADPLVSLEFADTRTRFSASGEAGEALHAERRHLEWFLLERPSDALSGVPLDVWREAVVDEQDETSAVVFESLRTSRSGVFEVLSNDAGELWCRDLLGMGEYPVQEFAAAGELSVGDLLVGRLYPLGEVFRLSPAMGVFRDSALVDALRGDLDSARARRRNTLRMAQDELEHLFFGVPLGAISGPRVDPVKELLTAGIDENTALALLEELEEARLAGASGHAVTELLNRLALESDADLGAAQRALLAAWAGAVEAAGAPEAPGHTPRLTPSDVGRALESFDERRRAGGDLEELFQMLERDLGLDDSDSGEADTPAPDFPGVVGAVVEEFLWEVAERDGEAASREHAGLRTFGEFGAAIGIFEELGAQHAIEFFTRWLPAKHPLAPDVWHRLLASFEEFARWVEESHQHPLWSTIEPELEALRSTVERLERLAPVREALEGAERFDVLARDEQCLMVRANDGEEREFRLANLDQGADALVPGDRVELKPEPGGRVRIGELWPVLRAPGE